MSLSELKASSSCKQFIPFYKEKHIKIAYLLSDTKEERKALRIRYSKLSRNIKIIKFKAEPSLIDGATNELGGLSEKIIKCYNLYKSLFTSSRSQKKLIGAKIDEKLTKIKSNAATILAKNYIHIKKNFSCILRERVPMQNASQHSYTEWLIIFYWCWFIYYRLSRGTLEKASIFFSAFNSNECQLFFPLMRQVNCLTNNLVFNVLAQYFFLRDAFNHEEKVLKSIHLVLAYSHQMIKFTSLSSSLVDVFKKIFNSKIIQKASECEHLDRIVDEFIDNTYLLDLPATINGYTLCNRVVMIRKLSNIACDYQGINTIVTFTLLTMIHEFGHFLQRFKLKTDYSWFEASCPKVEGIAQAGTSFMITIFKKEPKSINIEASRYILKHQNWEQAKKSFSDDFNKINVYSEARQLSNSPKQRRLGQKIRKILDIRKLGGCKYSGRPENRGKVND